MLRLGHIELDAPFVQAALSGYSDLPMRQVARAYGVPFALNEVMLDKLVVTPGKKQKSILTITDDDHPVGGQLMGANPDDFAHAARAMADAGYDAIDINFGCPVKKVLGRCRGGFLLSQPDAALDIVRRVYDAVGETHPVLVKMRRGMDDSLKSRRDFFTILDGAFEIGVSAVTVHGRTVKQRYVGPSNWSFLAEVKKHVDDRIIIGSGDIFSAEAAMRMLDKTGVDGVSIARGCIGNPWIFEECRTLYTGKPLPPPPSIEHQRDAIAQHFALAVDHYGADKGFKVMRKFGIKYSEHHPCARDVRNAFIAVKSCEDFDHVLSQWYDLLKSWPAVRRREGHGDLIAAGATE